VKREILSVLCNRCAGLISLMEESEEKLRLGNMVETLMDNNHWPDLKIGKWLGYIEGTLIANNVTTVNKERDFSRPHYHEYYTQMNIDIPKTTDVMTRDKND
jgi:hypothetical protein